MIRVFFKTIWNSRKRNVLVFLELFMISLVLVNLTVFLVNIITISKIKNCYDTDDVVLISLSKKGDEDKTSISNSFRNLKTKISSNPFVESVSVSTTAVPYNYNLYSTDFICGEDHFNMALRSVDIDYAKVMKITPLSGRWFDATDLGKAVEPIILSKDVAEKYYSGDAVGKRIKDNNVEYEIIGVVDHFKRSDIEKPYSCGFLLREELNANFWSLGILIRTKPGKTGDMLAIAEEQVYSTMNNDVWAINSLNSLENMHNVQNDRSAQTYYLGLIIALFVMINVFLGVIGILWYNTNLRIHEFGIKRALGSTKRGISRLLLAENLLIAIIGLTIVILIMLQIPAFTADTQPGVFTSSVLISVVTMIILVLISTWIPSSLASKIHPATALKTE